MMPNQKIEAVLAQIARKNNTTKEHVRREMQYAMDMAMDSLNPAVQARWAAVPRKGEKPTLEEFVRYLASLTTS